MSLKEIEAELACLYETEDQLRGQLLENYNRMRFFEIARLNHPDYELGFRLNDEGECPLDNEGDPNCKHQLQDDEKWMRVFCTKCSRSYQVYPPSNSTIDSIFPFRESDVFPKYWNKPMVGFLISETGIKINTKTDAVFLFSGVGKLRFEIKKTKLREALDGIYPAKKSE